VEHVWYTAAARVGLALLASLISMRIGLSVALVEIFLGFVAGNLGTHLHTAISPPNAWINFLASFDSVVLTFLAGAEIEPESFRRQLVHPCDLLCGLKIPAGSLPGNRAGAGL
jgi:Kef-type K+ transport system membrane component KefB